MSFSPTLLSYTETGSSYSLGSFQIEKFSVRDSSVAYKMKKDGGELRGNLKDGLKSGEKKKKRKRERQRVKSQGWKREGDRQREEGKKKKVQHSSQK